MMSVMFMNPLLSQVGHLQQNLGWKLEYTQVFQVSHFLGNPPHAS